MSRPVPAGRLFIPLANGGAIAIGPEPASVPLALIRRESEWLQRVGEEMAAEAAATPPGEEPARVLGQGMALAKHLDRHDRLCRALLMPELSKVLRGEVRVDAARYFATLARIVRGDADSEGGHHD